MFKKMFKIEIFVRRMYKHSNLNIKANDIKKLSLLALSYYGIEAHGLLKKNIAIQIFVQKCTKEAPSFT